MKKTILNLSASMLLMGGILMGCGDAATTGKQAQNQSQTNTEGTTENKQNEQSGSHTFNNYGREVTISGVPQKVLTFGPNASELFVALGLNDLIIGNSLDNHSRGALPEYREAYDRIPELTYGSATREAVITSGADFIYGIDWEFGEESLDVAELASMGMTTYMNRATNMDEIYQEIRDLGKIFQIEEVAENFITDQINRMEAVKAKLADQVPVKVLVYDSGGEGVFTAGQTNFETLLIEMAGGRNIFDDITDKQWTTVSFEEVLKRDPDVILIHDYDSPALEQKIADIKSNPALSQLESVKQERFVTISLESVLPGNRMAYSVESMASGFYPELFK